MHLTQNKSRTAEPLSADSESPMSRLSSFFFQRSLDALGSGDNLSFAMYLLSLSTGKPLAQLLMRDSALLDFALLARSRELTPKPTF